MGLPANIKLVVAVLKSIWRRHKVLARQSSEVPRYLIVSGGGSATTSLLQSLRGDGWNDPHDLDGLKHVPLCGELLSRKEIERVVFIHRNSDQVIQSLHRRGYCRAQSFKLAVGPLEYFQLLASGHNKVHEILRASLERQYRSFREHNGSGLVCSAEFHELFNEGGENRLKKLFSEEVARNAKRTWLEVSPKGSKRYN